MATRRRPAPVVPVELEPIPETLRSQRNPPPVSVVVPAPVDDPRDVEILRLRAEVERLTRWMDAMARRA
jgi:hypothetical protein